MNTTKYLCKFMSLAIFLTFVISCEKVKKEKLVIGKDAIINSNGRNDLWSFIGPGGGGAMFHPAINPSDPENVFVSCDMTGSFVTYDGGKKWRMFNLRGVTKFYSFDRNDKNIVYAGTSNLLFKSENKGATWNTIYPEPDNIVDIHEQGDHAEEVIVTKDSVITVIEKMIVDPDNSQQLHMLVRRKKIDYWPSSKHKSDRFFMNLMSSKDGGTHWELMDKLPFDINNIFIDPNSPKKDRTIYVSGKGGFGVKRNGNWENLGLPDGAGKIGQFVSAINPKTNNLTIYALSGRSYFNSNGNENDPRIYIYNVTENSWKRVGESLLDFKMDDVENPEFRTIATSFRHPNIIYLSFANLIINKDFVSAGVAKSEDYGKTWTLVWNDIQNIPAKNRTSGWLDKRFGSGWGENPFNIAVDENNPEICYTTDFGRTIRTLDGGKTWQQVYTDKIKDGGWKSRGLQVTTGYMLAFDPFDSLHVFMADTDTGLMESFDGTKSWTSATDENGVPRSWVNSTYWLQFDPEIKDKIWVVMSANHDLPRPKMWRNRDMSEYKGGVLLSTNGGKTWKPTSKDIGEIAPTHIILDPKSDPENRTLYICAFGKGVYKSIDDGKSWIQKNNGIDGEQPAAWRLTQKNNGDLYLVVFRKSDDGSIGNNLDGALYKSVDGAESWVKLNLPKGVNSPSGLVIDIEQPNKLILSAWGRYGQSEFSANQGGGIYLSEDDSNSWRAVLTDDQNIHDITVDEKNNVFYACGFNSSAYRSDDRGDSWTRIKGYNFKWGKRVQPDPMDDEKVYIITFGGGIWHGPAKGDKNALEDIVTPQTSYR